MEENPSKSASPAEELAFTELARLIQEKEASGLEMRTFIRLLEEDAAAAARKVEVARQLADVCDATKLRKPRSDKGKPRKTAQEIV